MTAKPEEYKPMSWPEALNAAAKNNGYVSYLDLHGQVFVHKYTEKGEYETILTEAANLYMNSNRNAINCEMLEALKIITKDIDEVGCIRTHTYPLISELILKAEGGNP